METKCPNYFCASLAMSVMVCYAESRICIQVNSDWLESVECGSGFRTINTAIL